MTALRSIFHSFVQTLIHVPWRRVPADLWRAGRGILRGLWHDGGDPELLALRNAHCQRCPMYDEHWRTCGTPGEVLEDSNIKIGCWCYLPLANRDPQKDCWARANGLDHVGWPDTLRPK